MSARELSQPRPGVVTFIGVLLYIKALLAAIASIAAFMGKGTEGAAQLGLSEGDLLGAGVGEAIAAVLLFLVAYWLMKGGNSARLLVAVVVGIRLAFIVWIMLTHHVGGYLFYGLLTSAFAIFVLWALYGNERADEFFAQRP